MNRLVWFRNDLRLHDNATLTAAVGSPGARVSFLFVYDHRWDELTPEGHPRIGAFRKQFIAESVLDLRERLRHLGADLICVSGNPVEVVTKACFELEINELYHARLAPHDEREQELAIETMVNARGVRCVSFDTHSLLTAEDYKDVDLTKPMGFSKLRKAAEKSWAVRAPLPPVEKVIETAARSIGVNVWSPESCLGGAPREDRGVRLTGGETKALARAHHFVWTVDGLRAYKDTRNGLMNLDDSSKFSAALSVGCISARHLYAEVRRFEREHIANASTLWFLLELLWRDHFYFASIHRGRHLFTDTPEATSEPKPRDRQLRSFEHWREGRTGEPFIDAAMNELRLTGWMSNRMRQNVASYLVHHLGVDWRWGARWFESCLIDYDCASNWGNWSYVAGAGPLHRPHVFDIHQQARMYDPDGSYADYWA